MIEFVIYRSGWIIEDLARYIARETEATGCQINITSKPSNNLANLYIHFIFLWARPVRGARNWVYVTHIDQWWKALVLLRLSTEVDGFIAMSDDTARLIRHYVPNSTVYVLPPRSLHFDELELASLRKTVVFGMFFNLYSDKRKGDHLIKEFFKICRNSTAHVSVIIQGSGFREIIEPLDCKFIRLYDGAFDPRRYKAEMLQCDYILYFGVDEGAISVLDGALLGIPVVAVAQGFHLNLNLPKGSVLVNKASESLTIIKAIIRAQEANEKVNRTLLPDSLIGKKLHHCFFERLILGMRIVFVWNKFINLRNLRYLAYLRRFALYIFDW